MDLINNMDHMRISGTKPSSVIFSQKKGVSKVGMSFPKSGVAVGLLSILGGLFTQVLCVGLFDCTSVAGRGKVGPVNRLSTPMEWVLSVAILLTVLSR